MHNRLEPYGVHYTQNGSNMADIEFSMHGNRLVIIAAYIQHLLVEENLRVDTWARLEDLAIGIPQAENLIVLGDLNLSLHARRPGEAEILGLNISGKHVKHLRAQAMAQGQWFKSNMKLFTDITGSR